ncbi:hypothetical protein OHR86_28100 [Streptomyces sp. NBC_00441]|uniref:hypothetical protein n=1 Tax=Streptomyces sp. NBC_00441 TaxID=2975742 RepID=UPI002E2E3F8E|nr:hypothetical protein [Streptomyces sp. NBC_00441]
MTTSPPQVNGHHRPLPVITDWQAFLGTPAEQPVVEPAPEPKPEPAEPAVDLVAQAEADAIRTRAYAEAEEQRIAAEAEAKAIEIKAEAEAEKLRLANERAAMRMERDRAEHEAHLEDIQRKREKAAREAEEQGAAAKQAAEVEAEGMAKVDKSAKLWKKTALAFAIMCAIVALPVQMSAFYNEDAKWLLAAPVMLEAGAWVILSGAAAAVAAHRPHWHYRLIAWALAFVAAGINLWHGLEHFDPATAIGTAFASLAGPGVWDLHEHGRIRRRDGVQTWRERKAEERAFKKEASEKANAERVEAERQAYKENAARQAAQALDEARAAEFPAVHKHALRLAADLGETAITEAIWKRAKLDVDGALPGESADILRMRNVAERRVVAARESTPVNATRYSPSSQVVQQVPKRSKRGHAGGPKVRGTRRAGDTPRFANGARVQASIAAKRASQGESA